MDVLTYHISCNRRGDRSLLLVAVEPTVDDNQVYIKMYIKVFRRIKQIIIIAVIMFLVIVIVVYEIIN